MEPWLATGVHTQQLIGEGELHDIGITQRRRS
jgi:hypothetical protein